MKALTTLLICFWQISILAQAPVTLTIDAKATGAVIPNDFIGLSFEASNLLPDANGHRLFSPDNQPLIKLFRNTGIRNLRVGGGTVDMPKYATPGPADIDSLFTFALAADVKVIYSFRLLHGDKTNAAAMAAYISRKYPHELTAFAIGNEPDWKSYHNKDPKIRDYPSFLAVWRDFADAIQTAVPGARFAGPDTGSDYPTPLATDTRYRGRSWTERFAHDEKKSGIIAAILQHDYVGQSARNVSVSAAVDAMLSQDWDDVNYAALYKQVLAHVAADRLPYRMTECNDYTGGVTNASNAFASALWALDYMHWWAAHGCAGVNFHNKQWLTTDTIYRDGAGNFRLNPKGYGLKAFDLGSHGHVITFVKLSSPHRMTVTAYAVSDESNLFLTIINKTHGSTATNIWVNILPKHFATAGGEYMMLESTPPADCLAKDATLGWSFVSGGTPWHGQWTPLGVTEDGQCAMVVQSASAAIVHLYHENTRQVETRDLVPASHAVVDSNGAGRAGRD